MKKIFRLLAIATAFGAVLAGCTRAEEDVTPANKEIKFSASVGTFQVKASDTAFEEGDAIGLFADDPVYVYNARLNFTGGALSPEEPVYWGDGQLLEQPTYFYAYYPFNPEMDNRSGRFAVAEDQRTHEAFTGSDFMVARAQSSPADGAVQLNFVHAFTKIVFTIDNQTADGGKVAALTLGNVRLDAEVEAGETYVWAYWQEGGSVKAASVTNADGEPAWAVIIPPQDATPVILVEMEDGRQFTFNTESSVYFGQSKRYNATVVIDDTTVGADFTSGITDWIDNGDIAFGQFQDMGDWYINSLGNLDYNWNWMECDGKTVRYINIAYHSGESFQFTGGNDWITLGASEDASVQSGVPVQLVKDGVEITLPQEGYWYLALNAATGVLTAVYKGGFPEPDNWSLIGTIYGSSWDTDYQMSSYQSGSQYKYYYRLTYNEGQEFKFRRDCDWSYNYGVGDPGMVSTVGDGYYSITESGGNICLKQSGVWYVELCVSEGWAYFYREGDIPAQTYELDQIEPIVSSEDNTSVSLTQVVYAVTTNGFVLFDGKYAIFVYNRSDSGLSVGDVVTVSGTKTTYNGVPEITGPSIELIDSDYPDMIDLTYMCQEITSQMDNFSADIAVPIEFEGELIDGKNMTVEDSNMKGCVYYAPASFGLANLTNHLIRVQGFYNGAYGNQLYIIATSVVDLGEVEHNDPGTVIGGEGTVTIEFSQEFLASLPGGGQVYTVTDAPLSFKNTSNYTGSVTELRIYKSSEFTVSASGATIVGIQFTCTATGTNKQGPGCFGAGAPEGYTYSSDGYVGVWEGSASEVTFKATDNQVRVKKLIVSYVPAQ